MNRPTASRSFARLIALGLACLLAACQRPASEPEGQLERLVGRIESGHVQDVLDELGFDESSEYYRTFNSVIDVVGIVPQGYEGSYADGEFRTTEMLPNEQWDGCLFYYVGGDVFAWLCLSAGWYSDTTGTPVDELIAEFMDWHQRAGGTVRERKGTPPVPDGRIHAIDLNGICLRMHTPDPPLNKRRVRFDVYRKVELLDELLKQKRDRYPQLWQFATKDTTRTFAELLALINEQGIAGVLQSYDFSGFTSEAGYPRRESSVDFEVWAGYTTNEEFNAIVADCYVGAYDEGHRMWMLFTGRWYEQHNDRSVEQLDEDFDQLLGQYGGGRATIDAVFDEYDMRYSYFKTDELYVTRKQYTQPWQGGASTWYTINVLEIHPGSDFPEYVPDPVWPPGESALPEPTDSPGPLERLVRLTAVIPVTELADELGQRDYRDLTEPGAYIGVSVPYTAIGEFPLGRQYSDDAMCSLNVTDRTFFNSLLFDDDWLVEWAGITAEELDAEFDRLFDSETYPAASYEQEVGDAPFKLLGERIRYGQMTIVRNSEVYPPGEMKPDDEWITFHIFPPALQQAVDFSE